MEDSKTESYVWEFIIYLHTCKANNTVDWRNRATNFPDSVTTSLADLLPANSYIKYNYTQRQYQVKKKTFSYPNTGITTSPFLSCDIFPLISFSWNQFESIYCEELESLAGNLFHFPKGLLPGSAVCWIFKLLAEIFTF